MFTEKLSSQLLPGSRSHSQHSKVADSQLRENAGSPAPPIVPSTSSGGSSKVHTSPSKVRYYLRSFRLCTLSSSTRITHITALPDDLQWDYPRIEFSAHGSRLLLDIAVLLLAIVVGSD
jgi:hypothetical protein